MRFKDLSIRWKLLLINSSASALALVLACTAFTTYDWISGKESMVGKLQVLAGVIADNSVSALVFDDAQAAGETLAALHAEPRIIVAVLYKNGKVFARYHRHDESFTAPLSRDDYHAFSDDYLDLHHAITYEGDAIGSVFIRSDLEQLKGRLSRYIALAGLFIIVAGAIAILVAVLLQRQVAAPIAHLATVARGISEAHDYSVRVPTSDGKDELGDLAAGFNEMLDQVQRRDTQLEDQVRQRTSELLHAKEEAEAANQAKSDFLAHISRELRTPISSIIGMAELTIEDELKPEQQGYLRTVLESGNNVLVLLNDLLDFARIEAGQMRLRNEPFGLRETLSGPLKGLAPRAQEKGLELILRIAPDAPDALIGDAGRIRQIVVNLVGNAIKFTHLGEVFVEASTAKMTSSQLLLNIVVSDTGIGISEDKRDLVFAPFTQADLGITRRYGGTGLGLTLSRELLRLMSGEISLQSKEGQGSTFRIGIPLAAAPQQPHPTLDPRELADIPVLVVDDNTSSRRVLVEVLQAWKMNVGSAFSGQEALDILRSSAEAGKAHTLLLADISMSGMDGIELARRVRADKRLADLHIILFSTVNSRQQDAAKDSGLRIAYSLAKPVVPGELQRAIYAALGALPENEEASPNLPQSEALHILLAEDTPANQRLATAILERNGHSVSIATNGREALTALAREKFDVVLMDVQMPEMSGIEATEQIRAAEAQKGGHIPIVALTAFAMEGDEERCLAAGMDAYLAKPFQAQQLLAMLKRVMAPQSQHAPTQLKPPPARTQASANKATPALFGPALGEKIATKLQRECPEYLEKIWIALADQDGAELAGAAGPLAQLLETAGANPAWQTARELEEFGLKKNMEEAEATCALLERQLEELALQLRRAST